MHLRLSEFYVIQVSISFAYNLNIRKKKIDSKLVIIISVFKKF